MTLNPRKLKVISKHTGKSGDRVTFAFLGTTIIKRNLPMDFYGLSSRTSKMDFKVDGPWNTVSHHGWPTRKIFKF